MAHLQGDLDKARIGFLWTLDKIEHCIKKTPNDRDIQELWGLTRNWLVISFNFTYNCCSSSLDFAGSVNC